MSFHHDHTLSGKRIVYLSDSGRSPRRRRQPLRPLLYAEAYRRWMVHTIRFTANSTRASIFSAVVLAALHKFKYRSQVLGIPPLCARTTQRTSNAEAGQCRGHTSYSVWFLHHNGYFYLVRTLRSLRSSMMISRPYETTAQRG